jgi:hypothetical protein
MSSLDDLKYALASAGHSPEEIEQAEQAVLKTATESWRSAEQVAQDTLNIIRVYGQFKQSMTRIMDGLKPVFTEVASALQTMVDAANIGVQPPTKPTEKTPYYHKSKQKWWQ